MPLTLLTTVDKRVLTALAADAITEVSRACVKFPFFPDKLDSDEGRQTPLERQLERAREWNDRDGGNHATGYSVFCEEFLEFIEAADRGDRAAADAELVQAMAMLMRIRLHLDDYCPAGKEQRENSNRQTAMGNRQ